jgi:hypothetical protein
MSFLTRVETQNFDIERSKQEGLKLEGFSRYDFELESIFKFPLIFKVCFLMQYECMVSCNMSALYILIKRKNGVKNRWHTYSQWQSRTHPHS